MTASDDTGEHTADDILLAHDDLADLFGNGNGGGTKFIR